MRIIACITAFLVTLFVGDRAVSFSARTVIEHSHNQFVQMYEGKGRADILLLGDSRVDRNISAERIEEMTSKRCLNLGLGGNSMLISEALLKDYVQRYGNPALVVIELGQSTVDPKTMGEMRIFSCLSPNIDQLSREIDPIYTAFGSVFTSLRYNDAGFWRLAAETFSNPAPRLLQKTIPPEIINRWRQGGHVDRPIYKENMEALRRICQFVDARRLNLCLLIGPSWNDFKRAITNFDAWKSALQEAAGSHPIHDYSDAFIDHPTYFNDTLHLNARGADAFVQKMCEDGLL